MNRVVLNTSYCLVFALLLVFNPLDYFHSKPTPNKSVEVSHETISTDEDMSIPLSAVNLFMDTSFLDTTICANDSLVFFDTVLYTAGKYTKDTVDINMVDSFITVNLSVATALDSIIRDTICAGDTLMFDGTDITTAGSYFDTIQAVITGCDSINFNLELVVNDTFRTVVMETICANETLTFGSQMLDSEGTYLDTLSSITGCDSIIQLELSIAPVPETVLNEQICDGQSFSFDGMDLTATTRDTMVLTAANTCDSLVILDLVVTSDIMVSVDTAFCEGDTILLNGVEVFNDTTFTADLQAAAGCDSTVTYNATQKPVFATQLDFNICEGDSVEVLGVFYKEDTTVVDLHTAINGCDSVTLYRIDVSDTTLTNINASICDGETFSFDGTDLTVTGVYPFAYMDTSGCDSTIIINLTVGNQKTNDITRIICEGESVTLAGQSISRDTTFSEMFMTGAGCDSIVNYRVEVLDTFFTVVNAEICEGESIDLGQQISLTRDTSFVENRLATNGCDSTIVYNLSVLDTFRTEVSETICAGDSIFLGDQSFLTDTTYTLLLSSVEGCDSTIVYDLTVLDTFLTNVTTTICAGDSLFVGDRFVDSTGVFTGLFTAANGCDSTVVVDLTVLDTFLTVIDTSFCANDTLRIDGFELVSDTSVVQDLTSINGCDSTVVINASTLDVPTVNVVERICAGESIMIGGETITRDTMISEVFTTINGCDSNVVTEVIVLDTFLNVIDTTICAGSFFVVGDSSYTETTVITNQIQTPSSCVTVTVNLTVADSFNIQIDSTICEGDTVFFQNDTLLTQGAYTYDLATVRGCDSIITFNLNVLDSIVISMDSTICEGDTVFFANDTLTMTGMYEDIMVAANGCDSTTVLNLNVLPSPVTMIDTSVCVGDSLMISGLVLDSTGVYTQSFTSVNGCDSTVIIDFTVQDSFFQVIDTVICLGDSVEVFDMMVGDDGTFTQSFISIGGCDSTVTYNVVVADTFFTRLNLSICDGDTLFLADTAVTVAGTYFENLQSIAGCDSTIQYNVNLLDSTLLMVDSTICAGDTVFLGMDTLTTSGMYSSSFTQLNGCDSTVMLNLTVLDSSLQQTIITVCQGDTVMFEGMEYFEADTITEVFTAANGCDSTIQLIVDFIPLGNSITDTIICQGDTVFLGNIPLTETGSYTERLSTLTGCDSVATINLTVLPSYDINIDTVLCTGETIFLGSQELSEDGFYSRRLTTVEGCDSVVSINLTIIDRFVSSMTDTICQGDSVLFGDQVLRESGFYTLNVPSSAGAGCDSLFELTLTVNPSFNDTLIVEICEGESYPFDGQMLTESGMYSAMLSTINGCDSLTMLDLTVNPAPRDTIEISICDNDVYIFGNEFLSDPGFYSRTLESSTGCDSIITVDLEVIPLINERVEISICEGDTYMFGNRELRVPGEYTGSFIGSGGCDSIVFLTLEIIPRRSSGFSVSICEGETYEFNDQVLDQSGIYQQTLMGSNGCDSIITLNLNVIPTSRTNIIQTICAGETYVFGNRTIRETGVYQDTFQAQNGCDIIFSLDLTVLPIFTDTLVETICAGQTFSVGNQNYTQTGIFTQTLTSIEGCDSTVVLDLTVTEAFVDTFNISVCQGDTFMLGTQALTSPGTYIAFLESLEGCDSTVTVNLDFQNPIDTAVSLTICSGETYFFGNRQLRFPGTYLNTFSTVNGCDSTVTLEFSIEDIDTTITIDSTGIFANAPEGTYQWIDCATDSIVLETDTALFLPPSSGEYKLVIITEFCSDTTNCFSLISTSTEEQLLNSDDFNVYPNPALNNLTIETDPSLMGIYQMKIMDFTGRVYQTNNIQLLPREEIEVNDLPAGMYLIHLFNRDIGSVRLRFLKIE